MSVAQTSNTLTLSIRYHAESRLQRRRSRSGFRLRAASVLAAGSSSAHGKVPAAGREERFGHASARGTVGSQTFSRGLERHGGAARYRLGVRVDREQCGRRRVVVLDRMDARDRAVQDARG